MSEERLSRIEEKLDRVMEAQAVMLGRQDDHGRRLDGIDHRLDGIDHRLDGIDHRLEGIDHRLDKLEIGQEQMRDEIKLLAEGHVATQAAIARSEEKIIAKVNARIDPLEQVVREHFQRR